MDNIGQPRRSRGDLEVSYAAEKEPKNGKRRLRKRLK